MPGFVRPGDPDYPIAAVRTSQHTEAGLEKFARGMAVLQEVREFYRTSGDVGNLFKLLVIDIAEYDLFYKKLIAIIPISDVSSNFVMEQDKYTTEIPT